MERECIKSLHNSYIDFRENLLNPIVSSLTSQEDHQALVLNQQLMRFSPFHICGPLVSSVQSYFFKEKMDEVYISLSSIFRFRPFSICFHILQLQSLTTRVLETFFNAKSVFRPIRFFNGRKKGH